MLARLACRADTLGQFDGGMHLNLPGCECQHTCWLTKSRRIGQKYGFLCHTVPVPAAFPDVTVVVAISSVMSSIDLTNMKLI